MFGDEEKTSKQYDVISRRVNKSFNRQQTPNFGGDFETESTVDDEEIENSSSNGECKCRVPRCWIPELKTLGKFICGEGWMAKDDLADMSKSVFMKTVIFSENPVLPSVVLASFVIYFAVAAMFFLDL